MIGVLGGEPTTMWFGLFRICIHHRILSFPYVAFRYSCALLFDYQVWWFVVGKSLPRMSYLFLIGRPIWRSLLLFFHKTALFLLLFFSEWSVFLTLFFEVNSLIILGVSPFLPLQYSRIFKLPDLCFRIREYWENSTLQPIEYLQLTFIYVFIVHILICKSKYTNRQESILYLCLLLYIGL